MPHKRLTGGHDLVRAGKFGAVGIVNTLMDFAIFNFFTSVIKLTLIQANIISTTIAMIFSFVANKQLVFKPGQSSVARQAVSFLIVTAFGLYVLQLGTIKVLTEVWLAPVTLLVAFAHAVGIIGHDQFVIKNSAKAVATIVSLVWNYIMYKKVVFS